MFCVFWNETQERCLQIYGDQVNRQHDNTPKLQFPIL